MSREHQARFCCVNTQRMSQHVPSHTGWFVLHLQVWSPPSDPRESNMKELGLLRHTQSLDNIRITQFDVKGEQKLGRPPFPKMLLCVLPSGTQLMLTQTSEPVYPNLLFRYPSRVQKIPQMQLAPCTRKAEPHNPVEKQPSDHQP